MAAHTGITHRRAARGGIPEIAHSGRRAARHARAAVPKQTHEVLDAAPRAAERAAIRLGQRQHRNCVHGGREGLLLVAAAPAARERDEPADRARVRAQGGLVARVRHLRARRRPRAPGQPRDDPIIAFAPIGHVAPLNQFEPVQRHRPRRRRARGLCGHHRLLLPLLWTHRGLGTHREHDALQPRLPAPTIRARTFAIVLVFVLVVDGAPTRARTGTPALATPAPRRRRAPAPRPAAPAAPPRHSGPPSPSRPAARRHSRTCTADCMRV